MQRHDSVTYYTRGYAAVVVNFPENQICCENCEFCYDDSMKRCWCRLTRHLVFNPTVGRSPECPLEMEEPEDGQPMDL